jgi:UDP-N-acetylenolpyruvoylglucosamine reductase
MDVHYRHCGTLENNYAVSATFFGEPSSCEEIENLMEVSMHKRRTSQPRESSAGCIFKNPEQCPAGKLIDELGLKGARVGGAKISEVHGNFLVNDGAATAAEILELIEKARETALRERGIRLETEVQIVGQEKGLHE